MQRIAVPARLVTTDRRRVLRRGRRLAIRSAPVDGLSAAQRARSAAAGRGAVFRDLRGQHT